MCAAARAIAGMCVLACAAQAAAPWTGGAPMNTARAGFTATQLLDGRILAAGGYAPENRTAEVYNPALNQWTDVQTMIDVRFSHSAALLPDGRVMVCGGSSSFGLGLSACEAWNPATNQWTP